MEIDFISTLVIFSSSVQSFLILVAKKQPAMSQDQMKFDEFDQQIG